MQVNRDGKPIALDVMLQALPAGLAEAAHPRGNRFSRNHSGATFYSEDLGLEVADMAGDAAAMATFKGYTGVVVRQVEDGSPAAKKGLEPGMLIRAVGKTPVANVEQFAEALKKESPQGGRAISGPHDRW